ncbi:MAG: hypothetical protein IJE19_04860 [Clostridia bacterium]|nr:hypothetical protein [Clostridia bacterium]
MKKSIKKILCTILAMAMAFGSLTAFAADGESIYANGIEIGFAGELKEGGNTVNYPGKMLYVTFNAEKDGYYTFVHESKAGFRYSHWLTWVETDENGVVTDGKNFIFSELTVDPATVVTLFRLKAGENKFVVQWQEEIAPEEKVTVSYLGAELTDIEFSEGIDYAMVYGSDIYEVYYSGVDYGDSYGYAFYVDEIKFSFDSGEKLEFDNFGAVPCMSETEIEDGLYDIEVFLEKEETIPAQIEVHPITHYVENVEADNPEKYVGVEYYDGEKGYYGYDGTYTVTLKNGDKIKAYPEENVIIPGTNPEGYSVYSYVYSRDSFAVIELGNKTFEEYEYTKQPATTEQNFNHMAEKVTDIINNFKWEFDHFYYEMTNAGSKADTLRAFGTWISHINNNILPVFGNIIAEFFDFVGYTVLHP